MRILKIWDAEYPWDVRVEKVSRTLTDAGHQVFMAARNRNRLASIEAMEEARVHRLRPLPFLGRRLEAVTQFPAFFNPRWITHLRRLAAEVSPHLILVRDLPLAPTAIRLGKRVGVPVVLDMAENYPAMIRAIWEHGTQRVTDVFVRNPRAVAAVERWVLQRCDHVIVVVGESAERLHGLGVAPASVTVVSNTPYRSRIPDEVPDRTRGHAEPLRLVYLGLMEAPRGIEVVLDALAILARQGVDVHLDLIGTGRDVDSFRSRIEALALPQDRVRLHGFIPYDEALAIVSGADIGLVPHIANESWNTTIPNKLFDYMSMGLPVITSDARPAARIVEATGCGSIYESESPAALARSIVELTDAERRTAAGRAGRKAVLDRYNWGVDGKKLVETIESLVKADAG